MFSNALRPVRIFAILVLLLLSYSTVAADHLPVRDFRANLNGAQENPPVETEAQGRAVMRYSKDLATLYFRLSLTNITDVTAAHVHCATPGQNGPVGMTLYSGDPVSPNGTFLIGTYSATNDGNSCGWATVADMQAAMAAGNAYINVHTVGTPSGEIRGQAR